VLPNEQQPYDIIDSIIANLREEAETNALTKLGTTTEELCAKRQDVRTSETNLGNLLTDMMRQFSNSSIAVLNAGAICCEDGIGPGVVTIGDIVNALPRDDSVATVTLSGTQVMAMLNNSVSRSPNADGRFLQVSGISFEYNVDTSDRDRCFNVHVGNQALNLTESYTCALPWWLLEKHDGYRCFEGVTSSVPKEFCSSLIQVIFKYFDKRMLSKANRYYRELTADDFDPVQAEVEGRIKLSGSRVSTSYYATTTRLGKDNDDNDDNDDDGGSLLSDGAVAHYQHDSGEEEDLEEEGVDLGARNVLSSNF
jgi:2',3'-cyclic-nucleotide 2'-phosphodiesterase (5'-nucleotidase family)